MVREKWTIEGYEFKSRHDYAKALKEYEAVEYIRVNTDLSNKKAVMKLYQSLTEKETFATIVGYSFLERLRKLIIEQNDVAEDAVPMVPVKASEVKVVKEKADGSDHNVRYKSLYEREHKKGTRLTIVTSFLAVIVVAMFVITYYSPKYNDSTYEEQILDRYSSWKQELEDKELELNEREAAVENSELKSDVE